MENIFSHSVSLNAGWNVPVFSDPLPGHVFEGCFPDPPGGRLEKLGFQLIGPGYGRESLFMTP